MTTEPVDVKGMGYLVSCLSVVLLAIPGLKSAKEDPNLLLCLLAGAALSMLGMFMRFLAHRRSREKVDRARDESKAALRAAPGVVGGR